MINLKKSENNKKCRKEFLLVDDLPKNAASAVITGDYETDYKLMHAVSHVVKHTSEESFNTVARKCANNGFVTDPDGLISSFNDEWAGAIIPAVTYDVSGPGVGCHIINTVDAGFRYITAGDDNKSLMDLGPVVAPCIIGNNKEPLAVLIPLNEQAFEIGMDLMNIIREEAHGKL